MKRTIKANITMRESLTIL